MKNKTMTNQWEYILEENRKSRSYIETGIKLNFQWNIQYTKAGKERYNI